MELLIQENDALQRKLQSQEDEFRLQNETLMQELSHVILVFFKIFYSSDSPDNVTKIIYLNCFF